MRLTAGGMSRRQAEALAASEEAVLEEFRKQAEETDSKAKKQTTAREALIQKMQDKLVNDGGFTPEAARTNAEVFVASQIVLGQREGMGDQWAEEVVDGLRIRQVMPPELQRAMAAQEQDMVVAALRGNTKGSTSRARAAAAELQAVLARQGWTPEQLSDEQLGQVIERMRAAGENDGREYRADRGAGGDQGGKYAPLDGATKARGWHGPVAGLVDAAEEYARRAGIDLKRQAYFITKEGFDVEFATRIAEAYEAMEHAPNDPAVRAAYETMIAETRAQYDVLVEMGYSFTFFGNDDDPYEGNPFNAMRDLRDNNTMAVYSTIAGHGSGYSETAVDDNPLLADTGLEWPGQDGTPIKVLANDLFRAVHDAFGHGLEGAGFRYDGEENAWQAHARLFSPAALPALTSETRGQNSWLNFGPKGEENRFAVLDDTTFADQKAGLLPSWAWTENVVPDMERDYEQDAAERLGQRGDVSGIGDVGVDARPSHPRLDRPPVNEDGTVTLDHFTDQEGLTETDPSAWGRSGKFLPDSERRRIGAAPGRTYFGIATQRGGYVNEFRDGTHPRTKRPMLRVTARIPFDRLYDMYGDPDGLKAVGRALPKDERGRYIYKGKPIDGVSLYERLIQDAGYAGYWTPVLGLTAAVFEPVEVVPYEAGRDDYQPRSLEQSAILPDTIDINGVQRPTRNSEGQQIARDEEGVRAFYEWFGDSKVVDVEGRPLVVYHGRIADFEAFKAFSHFGNERQATFRMEALAGIPDIDRSRDMPRQSSQRPSKVAGYVALSNPLRVADDITRGPAEWAELARSAEKQGFDGLVYLNRGEGFSDEEIAEIPSGFDLEGSDADFIAALPNAGDSYVIIDPEQVKSVDNRGTFDATDPRILYQRQFEQATIFYSALERAAQAVKTERAPAQQWIATLKNAPGVKAEELEWTGIIDWLEAQTGQVDKSQVVETIMRGGIVIEEIDLEAQQVMTVDDVLEEYQTEIYERAREEANQEFEDEFDGNVVETVREDLIDIDRETPDLLNPEVGPPYQPPSAYSYSANFSMKYTTLDSDRMERYMTDFDYELVVGEDGEFFDLGSFASKEAAQTALDEAKDNLRQYLFEYESYDERAMQSAQEYFIERYANEDGDRDSAVKWKSYSLANEDDTTYFEWLMRLPASEGSNPDTSPRTHWDQQGVVIHVRGHERAGANGKRILFLDEIQSDWHQQAASRFTEAKAEAVRQFIFQYDLDGEQTAKTETVPEELRKAANEAYSERKGHRAWPEIVKWLEANPSEEGAALLQSVADANRGYMAQPDPAKIERLRAAEEAARQGIEAPFEALTAAVAVLQAEVKPQLDEWLSAFDKRIEDAVKAEEIARGKWELAASTNPDFMELRIKAREAQTAVDTLKTQKYALQTLFARSPETFNLVDVWRVMGNIGMADEQRALSETPAYKAVEEANAAWVEANNNLSLREREHEIAKSGGNGIPDAPFKDTWPIVAVKRMIAKAAAEGYDQIAWIKQGENNGGMDDDVDWFYGRNLPNMVNKLLKPYKGRVVPLFVDGLEAAETPESEAFDRIVSTLNSTGFGTGNVTGEQSFRDGLARTLEQHKDSLQRLRGMEDSAGFPARIAQLEEEIAYLSDADARWQEFRDAREATFPGLAALDERKAALSARQAELFEKEAQLVRDRSFDEVKANSLEISKVQNERLAIDRERTKLLQRPTNLGFDITPELREAAASGFPLFQPDHRNMPRGRILFPGSDYQGAVIEMFQGRDMSTFVHEVSHFWLEQIKALAARPEASEQIKRDWQLVLDWFKANGHEVRDGIIPVGAHEMWARGGERYMREGKAPSVGLKRAFETFRSWLTNLYKTVRGLNSPITPEIREVFDRLLATDDEIAEARQMQGMDALFNSAVEAGMSPDEFANYQEQVASARAEAQGRVLEKAMADIAKRETRLGRERRRQIKDQVTKAAEDVPLFKALAVLKEERMDRAALVERFGEDVVGQLPSRVPPLYANEGTDPEIIAERAGFASAEDMVNAMVAAEADQKQAKAGGDKRNMKARFIDQMTDQAFAAQYGEPMSPEQMLEEAQDAVANDRQGEVIASEIAALARKSGKQPTPYQMARQWARGRVRQGVYVAEASKQALQRHRRAIAAAGREAEQALLAGDMEAAYRAKQKQMLSSALLMEAKAANEEIEAARARMERIAKARTMKSVDQDYLEQAHALLEEVELKQRSQRGIDRFEAWTAWSQQRAAEGFEVVVPETFMAQIGNTNWTRLPVEQVLGLDAAVKQVIHFGRLKQTLLDNKVRRDYEAVKAEIKATAALVGKKEPKSDFAEPGFLDSIKGGVASLDAALLKAETIFDWLDNGNPNGVFNRYVFRPIARAAARESDMLRDFYDRHRQNLEAIPQATLKTWMQKINTGWVERKTGQPLVLSRQQVIAMALNWGNAGNRQRLVDGYGLSEAPVEQFLMNTLTAEEWAFVQSTWDLIGELWPEIAAMERRVNGVEPDKVEAITFNTPHGPMRGGYYPAIYNTVIDRKAQRHAEESEDLFNAKTVKATTRASSTKERAETVKRPILLDLGVITRHMGEVIHDITHREAVIQAHKLLTDPEVLDEIDAVLGREYSEQLRPWVKYVANRWAHERSGNEGFARFFSKLRANATVVGMGFRFTTMMVQVSGYSNSIEYVGAAPMAEAVAKFSASPIETTRFVREKSGEMRNRFDNLDRDVNQEIRRSMQPGVKGGAIKTATAAKTFAFHGIGYMDMLVSVPTWLAGYNKALARGADEEQAIYEGDKAVRLSQGSGDAKDLAAVQRGTGPWGEALKLMTMFYSYMSAFYQRQRRLGRDVARAGIGDVPGLMARAWWLLVVPPLLSELLAGRGPEDDEDWTWWSFNKIISQMLGPIPVVRDLYAPIVARATGEPSFGYRFTPAQGAFETSINVAGDIGNVVEGEDTKRMTRNVLELVGYSTGLVPGQLAASTQFLVDVGYGEQDPQTAGDWFEGLTKGKMSED
jgi:hypothetical protein